MKRIAIVGACPYPVPQGSQVLITETARCLQQAGHEVHLVVYGYGEGKNPDGLQIHRTANVYGAKKTNAGPSLKKPLLDYSLVRLLKRVVREHHIDIVHAHNYEGLVVALAAGHRPIIYHAHNLMADELPHYFGGASWAGALGKRLDSTYPRRADITIALHDQQAAALREAGVHPSKLHVVPPSIDLEAFRRTRDHGQELAFLYTGNLDSYQNIEYMKYIHKRVCENAIDNEWLIATNDSRPIPFGTRIPTPDLQSLINCLTRNVIMVCPRTSWSGYPMKILNGMAAGVPVVATLHAPGPIQDGKTGILMPADDAEQAAKSLIALSQDTDEQRRLGATARAYVETHHSREAIAQRLIATWPE